MHRAIRLLPALVLVLGPLAAPPARAAEGVDADRPDLAESPRAVAPRSVQLEAGVTTTAGERASFADESVTDFGEVLVRLGLARGWEARLSLPSWHRERRAAVAPGAGGETRTTGFSDAAIGVKRELPSPHPRLAAGVIAEASLPIGEAPFGGADAGAGLVLAASLETAPGDWCANVGLARAGGEYASLATLAFSRELAGPFSAFAEVARIEEGGAARSLAGAGLLWLVADGTQLDVRGGAELAGGERRPLVGLGVVRRW